MGSLTDELNEQQKAAVMYNEGHSLIVAGAGSGKTRVLTFKIAYLLHLGLPAERIMALTFTNKAAAEMKKRVGDMVGHREARNLLMGTFHSVFSGLLRADGGSIGIDPNFTIYDTDNCKSLITTIIKDMGLKTDEYKPADVQNVISSAKNKIILPANFASSEMNDYCRFIRKPRIGEIYREYERQMKICNALDFDDLLLRTYFMLLNQEAVRERYRQRFAFILVDEYQDTNVLQYKILRLFVSDNNRICVVGDDAQSIYKFRGAEIRNILSFEKTFRGARLFKLEQNYRSSANIVAAANSLIKHNRGQIPKNVFSTKTTGDRINVVEVYNDFDEAEYVSSTICDMHARFDIPYREFAVLYRFSGQLRKIEDAMMKKKLPYEVYSGMSFYERAEVKDILAYLRLFANQKDNESLKRVIRKGTGIGDTTLSKVHESAALAEVSDFEVVCNPEKYNVQVNAGIMKRLHDFADFAAVYIKMMESSNAAEIADVLTKALKKRKDSEEYATLSEEDKERVNNIEELVSAIYDFCKDRTEEGLDCDLISYLNNVALLTGQDNAKDDDSVKLMTMHAAKGLEFDTVFITGVEEGLFPSKRDDDEEEERRLMYVALTRAKEHCNISYADYRMLYNSVYDKGASKFISEIDKKYLVRDTFRSKKSYDNFDFSRSDDSFFSSSRSRRTLSDNADDGFSARRVEPAPAVSRNMRKLSSAEDKGDSKVEMSAPYGNGKIYVGTKLMHQSFGEGEVKLIEQDKDGYKVKVDFKTKGEKTMLLKFAKFTIIS